MTGWQGLRFERLRLACGALLLSVLGSCGGGGGGHAAQNGGVGGGTGISVGTVTGFGSVLIEGHAYDSAAPRYFNDDDPGTAQPATAVRLGQRLQLLNDHAGSAALIEPDLVGPVQSVSASAASFTVNGLRIRVNSDPAAGPLTFYSGLSGFPGLRAGSMVVEADGAFGMDAQGRPFLQATRIAQLPTGTRDVRLTGLVSGLDAAARSFVLDGVRVRLRGTTPIYPAGSALRDGDLVNVWSPDPIRGGAVDAGVVRVRSLLGASGSAYIGGLLSSSPSGTSSVAGIGVVPANAQATAQLQALHVGEYVIVQGRVAAGANYVLADTAQAYSTQPAQVSLRGNITGYVDDAHFLVRGVPVDASGVSPGSRLGNGVFVQLLGGVDPASPNTVLVSSLRVLAAAPQGGTVDLRGRVSQFEAANGSFVLSWHDDGVTMASMVELAPNAVSSGSGTLADGAYVQVEATQDSGILQAYSVELLPAPEDAGGLDSDGRVYGLGATSFRLNGLDIQLHGVVPRGGALSDGARVDVRFVRQAAGRYLAQDITVEP